jgi:uncharacterized protein YndB with AHSA1/START domain
LDGKVLQMKKIKVEKDISIAAELEIVWEAITTADQMREWWGDPFEIEELKAGAAIHFGRDDSRKTMKVETAAPPKKFVIRWPTPEFYGDAEILTTFDLKKEKGGTRIKVTETGFEGLPLEVRGRRIYATADTYQRMLEKLKLYAEYKAML